MGNELKKKLDKLNEALAFSNEVAFKFNEESDKDLLDWFIDKGEIRAYRFGPHTYRLYLKKGNIKLLIGAIWYGKDDVFKRANPWVNEYLSYFWKSNKNLVYCTNNLLKSPEEIRSRPDIFVINEKTYKHADGSFSENNVFDLSCESSDKTCEKHEKIVIKILDSNHEK